jgi:hypothetical protein
MTPQDLPHLASDWLDANNHIHVPTNAPWYAKPLNGLTVPTPTVVDGQFHVDFNSQGLPLTADIGVTVQDGHAVATVSTDNPMIPDDPVTHAVQQRLDHITGGRPVQSVTIDNSGLHITYRK